MPNPLFIGSLLLLVQAQIAWSAVNGISSKCSSMSSVTINAPVSKRILHWSITFPAVATDSVVINELMPDPNPVVDGLPDAEFVELYNNGSHTVNAQGWALNQKAIPDFSIPAGGYIILCKSTHAEAFAPYGTVVGLSSWPTLKNSGGTLVLQNADGQTVDEMTYEGSAVTGGYSIERIDPTPPCDQRPNYGISTSPNGATPGARNAIFDETPDTQAPTLLNVAAEEAQKIRLVFDEAVDGVALQATLSPEVPIAEAKPGANEKEIILLLAQSLASGTTYTVRLSTVRDCSGNQQNLPPRAFVYDDQPPAIQQVLLLDTADLLVVYDEAVTSESATQEKSYQVNNGVGGAIAIEQRDSASVRIRFAKTLNTQQNNLLTITGVADVYGNVAPSPLTHYFTYQNDVDTVVAVSAYQVDVRFRASLAPVARENFSLDRKIGQPSVAWIDAEQPNVAHLVLAQPLSPNKVHTLSFWGINNLVGNRLSTPAYRFQYDTKAPKVDSIVSESVTSLVVYFNEAVQWKTVRSFKINKTVGFPTTATPLAGGKAVRLQLARSLNDETSYQLSITDLSDLSGNTLITTKTFLYDQRPPALLEEKIMASHQINLTFSEPLLRSSALKTAHYTLNTVQPDSVVVSTMHPEQVRLFFADPIPEHPTILRITQLSDRRGNVMTPTKVSVSNQYPTLGEIVVLSPTSIRLNFSKALDSERMQSGAHYQLIDYLSLIDVVVDGASATLTLSDSLLLNQPYFLKIITAVDTRGNQTSASTHSFTYQTFVENVVAEGASSVLLTFTVPLDAERATNPEQYMIKGIGSPAAAVLEQDHVVRLVFSKAFNPQTIYTLTVQNLLNQDKDLIPLSYHTFGQGEPPTHQDLLITEIMADPSPAVGLPEVEYLELYNPTERVLSTQGLRLSDRTTTAVLPDAVLAPNEYVILCAKADQEELAAFGRVLPVSNFPSLNITGDSLRLTNSDGNEIVSLAYTNDWYNDAEKKQGGWSLEMIDTRRPCGGQTNWTASTAATGGTPGQENASKQDNPDGLGPRLINAIATADTTVVLYFDEILLPTLHAQVQLSDGLTVDSFAWSADRRRLILRPSQSLSSRKQYTVQIGNVTDCSGNLIRDADNTVQFTLTEPAELGDVLLSELLFYPRPNGEKFVEIYNHSEKAINLKGWKLTNINGDSLINLKIIIAEDYLLRPEQYLALTEDAKTLKGDYSMAPVENLLEIAALPSLPSTEGSLVLLNAAGTVMQQMAYQDTYHHPILRSKQGVSLERIDWNMPTHEPDTWQSAASTVNHATPGYENSQSASSVLSQATLTVEPKVFAPDNTGDRDYTRIHYAFAQPGGVANVTIFDAQGQAVKKLANNLMLAATGHLVWNGTNDERQQVNVGYYIIYFEIFDTEGRVNVLKDKVVVGSELR